MHISWVLTSDHITWSHDVITWRDHMTWSIWYLLRFTPQQFLERTKKMGLEVGLVIDLTNTNRYYSPQVSHCPVRWGITNHLTWFVQEFPHGIRYHKIFCEGHVIPSEEVYRKYVLDEMGWIVEYNVCILGFLVFWKISCYLKPIKVCVCTYIHTYLRGHIQTCCYITIRSGSCCPLYSWCQQNWIPCVSVRTQYGWCPILVLIHLHLSIAILSKSVIGRPMKL